MQIRSSLAGLIIACLTAGGAFADSMLDDFNQAVEAAMGHHRVTLGYLRTGNVDLAAIELERMGEAWQIVLDRFGKTRPSAFAGSALYGTTLLDVSMRMTTAMVLIDARRIDSARESLVAIRRALAALRKEAHVPVLADCILDANDAMDAFVAFRDQRPDLTKADVSADVATKADNYATTLARCDAMAPDMIKREPEFRRLIDGALSGAALVSEAIEAHDSDRLYRIIIELRSFDNLLAFRFG